MPPRRDRTQQDDATLPHPPPPPQLNPYERASVDMLGGITRLLERQSERPGKSHEEDFAERFCKQGPKEFAGTTDPLVAEERIRSMETIYDYMGLVDVDKANGSAGNNKRASIPRTANQPGKSSVRDIQVWLTITARWYSDTTNQSVTTPMIALSLSGATHLPARPHVALNRIHRTQIMPQNTNTLMPKAVNRSSIRTSNLRFYLNRFTRARQPQLAQVCFLTGLDNHNRNYLGAQICKGIS
ncbi:hypothetical protein F511_13178 [Dorcoceras hygrometricum]|uniref:Uncharacterized protein n=1 Tax=Dorcoceras hygrometricum TaxID=472368 RepID=A0A2Z7BG14_9LAMI|nr:hypothetical protein F511_13178 [Dorcoceras hygrometricum]